MNEPGIFVLNTVTRGYKVVKTDIEISQEARLEPIEAIAERAGILPEELEPYGRHKAKISLNIFDRLKNSPEGRLILVTSINPTPAGEGKTTVTVGLGQALARLGAKTVIALREPSLGPCFGVKGGATGGGYSQVLPMEDINLHFTGDIHAVGAAHNLAADLLDNSVYFDNPLNVDPHRMVWPRVMDLNDRFLRHVIIGLGGRAHGIPRETGFDITTASEVMACLCLCRDLMDLKSRLKKIIVAYARDGRPVTAEDIKAVGSMTVLLKDAVKPNLVQTLEHVPALIHGGPFANIAHGCSSLIATRLGLKLSDYLVTEAGFGADLGAEKFFDIKCRELGRGPDAVVIVASIRALKMHGGRPRALCHQEDLGALDKGFANLAKHIENVKLFGIPSVVALNRFPDDTEAEIKLVEKRCREMGARFALATVWADGGAGGIDLAHEVISACEEGSEFSFLYDLSDSVTDKIERIATRIYGAQGVKYEAPAKRALAEIEALGYSGLPICVAKTQYSLSDNPALLGRPEGFEVTVRDVRLSAGAGFIVPLMGNILTMPGLSRTPAAFNIDIDEDGRIYGLF